MRYTLASMFVLIVLSSCTTTSPAAGPTDDQVAEFCDPVIAAIEAIDPTDVTTMQEAFEVIASHATRLDVINSATLVAETTGLKAAVQAGGQWSTERVVNAVNTVCGSDLESIASA